MPVEGQEGQLISCHNTPVVAQKLGLGSAWTRQLTTECSLLVPANPPALRTAIHSAISLLRKNDTIHKAGVTFAPWAELNITAKPLISQITKAIDPSKTVALDLTDLNDNVAFDLGYAIGTHKQVWPCINSGIADTTRNYSRRYTRIFDLGYAKYQNHQELARAFVTEAPWESSTGTILHPTNGSGTQPGEGASLLYVKPPLDTDSLIAVGEAIRRSIFSQSYIVDDPNDNSGARLAWYVEKIGNADAVLLHLLSNEDRDAEVHNGRTSFIAGLAYGLGKHVLMLAREPFRSPTDFESLLYIYKTAQDSERHFDQWASTLELPQRQLRSRRTRPSKQGARVDVSAIVMGDHVAEHEGRVLDDYFVETMTYKEVQRPGLSIIVGRPGSGKTATLIALQEEFRRNNKVHVCAVSPVEYEVAGILRLLAEEWPDSERAYLIESLWKFLLYSELAESVVAEVSGRPAHHMSTDAENRLVDFVSRNEDTLTAAFSQRVSRAVDELRAIETQERLDGQRLKLSELLHRSLVGQLRQLLGRVIADKERVMLLVDRLDEQWRSGADTDGPAALLQGLFRVAQSVVSEFRDEVDERQRVNIALGIFIRSDILANIGATLPERDKLPIQRILWKEPELLMRIVHERLAHSVEWTAEADQVWQWFFPATVGGAPTLQFVAQRCLPRPRDVLVMTKNAVRIAADRSHSIVLSEDLETAYEEYSRYVLGSIASEDDPGRGQLENILYELAGVSSVLSESEIRSSILRAGVPEADVEYHLHLLCDVSVLGIETSQGYVFPTDEDHRQHLMRRGKVLAGRRGALELSYRIHPAFHSVLEITWVDV